MSIQNGDRGDDVVKVQTALVAKGYNVGPEGIDGIFGQHTEAAVKQFQSDNGLDPDGIVGDQTAALLFATAAPEQKPSGSGAGKVFGIGAVGLLAWLGWKKFHH